MCDKFLKDYKGDKYLIDFYLNDNLVGIGWGLLDVGLLSLRGRYNYIYLIYIGKGIFEKYFGV